MLPMAAFTCSGCGDCCRGFGREATMWEREEGPGLRLTDEPGLPLLSWEWHRLQALAAERGLALATAPFDAVLDEAGKRVVVLSYRLAAMQCPFLEERDDLAPGPRSPGWGFAKGGVCSIYAHRPLACRAYQLVPLSGGIALSLHCPDVLDVDLADDAAMEGTYGGCLPAAKRFKDAPQLAVELLHQLERRRVVRVARDAQPLAREAKAAWPRVDVCELAEAHGLPGWRALEVRAREGLGA